MNKMFQRFADIQLSSKLRIMIVIVSAVSSILIVTILGVFSRQTTIERGINRIELETQNAIMGLDTIQQNIMVQFVRICGTNDFASDVLYMRRHPLDQTTNILNTVDEINKLYNVHYLVSDVYFLSRSGDNVYSRYLQYFYGGMKNLVAKDELDTVHGVSFLSERRDPVSAAQTVIPMVIPIVVRSNLYIGIQGENETADMYVILLLNKQRLSLSLQAYSLSQNDTDYYLVSPEGQLIASINNKEQSPVLPIGLLDANGIHSKMATTSERMGNSWITAKTVSMGNLMLVGEFHLESLIDSISRYSYLIGLMLIVIVIDVLTISVFMRKYVVNPIVSLSESAKAFQREQIAPAMTIKTKDEIGQLQASMYDMYETIQTQISKIAEEEATKYKMELKIYTEQTNPHFLYNTLEEIRSEVASGESGTAIDMIQSLAEYMRISLSGGADQITIANEIKHAASYLRIMNQRFRQSIQFVYRVDAGLDNVLVPKSILQPLIENSVRHGFGVDASTVLTLEPCIEVYFNRCDNALQIIIQDNGNGFDVAEITRIMTEEQGAQGKLHIGINNVYLRLKTFFGEGNVKIRVSSIPYYQNTFDIMVLGALDERC